MDHYADARARTGRGVKKMCVSPARPITRARIVVPLHRPSMSAVTLTGVAGLADELEIEFFSGRALSHASLFTKEKLVTNIGFICKH